MRFSLQLLINHSFGSLPGYTAGGLKSGLTLDRGKEQDIRYCLGAIAAPDGWSEVVDVQLHTKSLSIIDISGSSVSVPFDGSFFN